MRHIRRLPLSAIGVATLTLGLLLSGCGGTSNAPSGQGLGQLTAASTATAGAEATMVAGEDSTATAVASSAFPTATTIPATAADVEMPGCPPIQTGGAAPNYGKVGALNVSTPQIYAGLNYPSELMPNNAPNAPFQIPLTASVAQQPILFHPNPPVNPSLETGYLIQVCNQTSAAHTVTGLSVKIASFTPSSGPVTVWHLCQDGPYDAATRQTTDGCGGAAGQVDWLAATLPHDSAGASAPAKANAQMNSRGPNLPVTISPNKSIAFLIAVNGLTSQGTYALTFGVGVDGATPATLTPSDGSFLIAPSLIVWTGTTCQTSAMQAKIPVTTKDIFYVCPPAA